MSSMEDFGIPAGAMMFIFAFYAVLVVVMIAAYWQIWSKAGYSGAWSLLMLVPLANIIAFFYLAFSDWPVRKQLRAQQGGGQAPLSGV